MSITYNERFEDFQTALRSAMGGWQAKMWTSAVGLVSSVDLAKGTIEVQPATMSQVRLPDGSLTWVQLPLLVDVPIIILSGGGMCATFPVAVGNEALVLFASRCIDSWWQSGKISVPPAVRMHDLSDGFALVGPRSVPNALPGGIAGDRIVLRTVDNMARVELTQAGEFNIVAPGGFNVMASTVFTGPVEANGKPIDETHQHTDVQTGGDLSGDVA